MASKDCKILSFKIPVNGVAYTGTINETSKTVSVMVPFGTPLTNLTPAIVISAGATISPESGAAGSFATPVNYTVTAEDGTTKKVYSVIVKEKPDATVIGVHNFTTPGWSNVRNIIGNLGSYVAGGIDLGLKSFSPKFVIGVQVDKGYVGYYDLNAKVLRVYKSGVEATADETVEFSVVLMGQ
jgi:hypothetical protein